MRTLSLKMYACLGLLGLLISCKKADPDPVNQPPIANAGADYSLTINQKAALNGTASSDPEGKALVFAWILKTKPAGSNATITKANQAMAEFTPDVVGEYLVELSVSDGSNSAVKDEVKVTANTLPNNPPIANAGAAQSVTVNAKVTLNGSTSSDPDNDPLTYAWTLKTKPTGSTAIITKANQAIAEFTPDVIGTYIAQLSVTDGKSTPVLSEVTITVTAVPPGLTLGKQLKKFSVYNKTTNALILSYTFATDARRNVNKIDVVVVSQAGVQSQLHCFVEYDASDRITKVTTTGDGFSEVSTALLEQDSQGRITKRSAGNQISTYEYNAMGLLVKCVLPSETARLERDAKGRILKHYRQMQGKAETLAGEYTAYDDKPGGTSGIKNPSNVNIILSETPPSFWDILQVNNPTQFKSGSATNSPQYTYNAEGYPTEILSITDNERVVFEY